MCSAKSSVNEGADLYGQLFSENEEAPVETSANPVHIAMMDFQDKYLTSGMLKRPGALTARNRVETAKV